MSVIWATGFALDATGDLEGTGRWTVAGSDLDMSGSIHVADTTEQARAKAKEVTPESAGVGMQQARQLARENPVPVMVGSAAFGGFILGWIAGRR